jgi:hypothetical protein
LGGIEVLDVRIGRANIPMPDSQPGLSAHANRTEGKAAEFTR